MIADLGITWMVQTCGAELRAEHCLEIRLDVSVLESDANVSPHGDSSS